jgi:hypothetical protein
MKQIAFTAFLKNWFKNFNIFDRRINLKHNIKKKSL